MTLTPRGNSNTRDTAGRKAKTALQAKGEKKKKTPNTVKSDKEAPAASSLA